MPRMTTTSRFFAGVVLGALLVATGCEGGEGYGAPGDVTTIQADQPFRIRFEPGAPVVAGDVGLQVSRSGEAWVDVKFHDFPKPEVELRLNFADASLGDAPEGWLFPDGRMEGVTVEVDDGGSRLLRVGAGAGPVTGLYMPPWEPDIFDLVAEIRIPSESRDGAGFAFGYAENGNHCRVLLIPGHVFASPTPSSATPSSATPSSTPPSSSGTIRVSCVVDGEETIITEEPADIPPDTWLYLEVDYEDGELEVDFNDETLEFEVRLDVEVPPAPLGFHVPAGNAAEFRNFRIEGEAETPPVSLVNCDACYASAADGANGEFEWTVVVRRWADGPVSYEEGDLIRFRLIDEGGAPIANGGSELAFRLTIPPGHLGGTFVETPGRIGPWRASNGELYFVMEPSETDDVFMMMKSSDEGRTWREVDGGNRPRTDDLESVDGRVVNGHTIHLVHQVTRSTVHHAFRTSDHPDHPDTWAIRDETAATAMAIFQSTSLVVRSDGSMVVFHTGMNELHYNVRSPEGVWGIDAILESDAVSPQAILGADDAIHLAYYAIGGTIRYRRLLPDGSFTPALELASGVGTSESDYGAVLPLIFIPETNTVAIFYRLADGGLWERRIVDDEAPMPPVRVSDRDVVRDAVDAQQPGADVVLDGETIHVLFIDESSRSIYHVHDGGARAWSPSAPCVEGILGSWVRGNVYTRSDGARVYGYVYDAGSDGGSGMNRFAEVVLDGGAGGGCG